MFQSRKSKIIGIVIVLFLIIQLVPNKRPEVQLDNPKDLIYNNKINKELADQIKASCYDCHSNETKYPWYSYVAPAKWLVNRDTREGRKALNFSAWEDYDLLEKAKQLGEIEEVIETGEMPMKIYLPLHPEARLNDLEKQELIDWFVKEAENLFN